MSKQLNAQAEARISKATQQLLINQPFFGVVLVQSQSRSQSIRRHGRPIKSRPWRRMASALSTARPTCCR